MPPPDVPLLTMALAHHQANRLPDAEILYRQVLQSIPDHAIALNLLGVVAIQSGRPDQAAELIGRAIALEPNEPAFHNNLGNAWHALGQPGNAAQAYRRTLALKPDHVGACYNLANVLLLQGQATEARSHFEQALALAPDNADIHNNLGVACKTLGRLDDAVASFERVLSLRPDNAEAHNNLGHALQDMGQIEAALVHFEQALTLRPDYADALSNLIYTQACSSHLGLAALAASGRRFNRLRSCRNARPAAAAKAPLSERPRLGFVSGDFRRHAVGLLVCPTLEGLAQAGHAFVCYSNNPTSDALTARFKTAAAEWRSVFHLSDQAMVEMIRADKIDLLIDLSGHSAFNRLPVFAARPAPVQATWLGAVSTTGLEAMDYFLADPVQVPMGTEVHYREKIVRLPQNYVVYQPPLEDAKDVSVEPLPALKTGRITFGSFNALRKITPAVIAAWCQILRRVPTARLVMKTAALGCDSVAGRMRDRFTREEIALNRVLLLGPTSQQDHLAWTQTVDIALDPFPYTGGLTTLETLWMGVPVVTWAGETLCARHSAAYLTTLGLTGLIASDLESYIETAVALASDMEALAHLRAGLRVRFRTSPLCDIAGFVRQFETACQAMWNTYRSGQQPRAIFVTNTSDEGL